MQNVHIPGAVRFVGARQGFTGISVLYGSIDVDFGKDDIQRCPTVTTAWRPTSEEIVRLRDGEVLVISLLAEKWPPCTISVKELDEVH